MIVSIVGVGVHNRYTLVEPNYVLVTCFVYGKIFRMVALLGIILDLECI